MTAAARQSAHLEHRHAFREFVLNEAEPWHREHLARLYDLWAEWNERFCRGRLEPPYLLLAEPSNPRRHGDCGVCSGFGGQTQIRIRRSLLSGTHPIWNGGGSAEDRFRFVADVLLHEQIHQYHLEVSGLTEEHYHGHGPAFRDTANRIGELLGLGSVRTCKRRGPDRDRPSCSHWPHVVRPPGFYGPAYRKAGDSKEVTTRKDDLELVLERALRLDPKDRRVLIELLREEGAR